MVRANNKRLNQIVANLVEVISNLNTNLTILENIEIIPSANIRDLPEERQQEYVKMAINKLNDSFRGYILNLFSSVEEYLAFSLKTSGFSVNNKTIRECLSRALLADAISSEFSKAHKSSIAYRNNMAHRYNEPTTEELIEWWKVNKQYYIDFIEFIKDKYKNELNNTKNMKCF